MSRSPVLGVNISPVQMSDLFFNFGSRSSGIGSVEADATEFAEYFTHADEYEQAEFIRELVADYKERV